MIDLQRATEELKAARHRDSRMADWAREWGPKLIADLVECRECGLQMAGAIAGYLREQDQADRKTESEMIDHG